MCLLHISDSCTEEAVLGSELTTVVGRNGTHWFGLLAFFWIIVWSVYIYIWQVILVFLFVCFPFVMNLFKFWNFCQIYRKIFKK